MEVDPAGGEEVETNNLPQVEDLATSLSLLGGHMFPEEDTHQAPELQAEEAQNGDEASPGRGSDPGEATGDRRGGDPGEPGLTRTQPEERGAGGGRPPPDLRPPEEAAGERPAEARPGRGSDPGRAADPDPGPPLEVEEAMDIQEDHPPPPPPPPPPLRRDEDVTAEAWRRRRKHVFVLSEAGKPIYSRHGSEEALSSTMGVMMALVSFVQSAGNAIRSVHSEEHTVVFLQQGPLLLVCVSSTGQPARQLRRELRHVHRQILGVLTRGAVARAFALRTGYDLRRLLAGAERVLDAAVDRLAWDAGLLLEAVRCAPSEAAGRALRRAAPPAGSAFALLAARGRVLALAQERAVLEEARLAPADLHLLLNLVGASSAFRAGEVWTPVCLPGFNPDGYFYAYVSYLDLEPDRDPDRNRDPEPVPPPAPPPPPGESADLVLALLSTEREGFYAAAACRRRIEAGLRALEGGGWWAGLAGGGAGLEYGVGQVGVADLRHFLYKPYDVPEDYRQLTQYTSPEMEAPYSSEEEQLRLLDLYRHLHGRVHSCSRPLKLLYHVAEKETLLAWVTSKFELYSCFSPLVTKARAIAAVTKLLRWLKKEEERLFIRCPPRFSSSSSSSSGGGGGGGGAPPPRDQAEAGDNGFLALL